MSHALKALAVPLMLASGLLSLGGDARARGDDGKSGGMPKCEQTGGSMRAEPPQKMFSTRYGRQYGLAVQDGRFQGAETILVWIWLNNESDKPQNYFMCCNKSFVHVVDVYDADGHRLQTNMEKREAEAKRQGKETVEVCTCSAILTVPAHACRNVDMGDLTGVNGWELLPGHYTATLKPELALHAPESTSKQVASAPEGIEFTINEKKSTK